jgi:hypothetical protein
VEADFFHLLNQFENSLLDDLESLSKSEGKRREYQKRNENEFEDRYPYKES